MAGAAFAAGQDVADLAAGHKPDLTSQVEESFEACLDLRGSRRPKSASHHEGRVDLALPRDIRAHRKVWRRQDVRLNPLRDDSDETPFMTD
jgi:hypothetical protein